MEGGRAGGQASSLPERRGTGFLGDSGAHSSPCLSAPKPSLPPLFGPFPCPLLLKPWPGGTRSLGVPSFSPDLSVFKCQALNTQRDGRELDFMLMTL